MTDLLRTYLELSFATRKEHTFKWYKLYFVSFDAIYACRLRARNHRVVLVDSAPPPAARSHYHFNIEALPEG